MRFLPVLLISGCVFGGGIERPSIGYARAADGSVRRVSGIAGTLISEITKRTQTVSAACSGRLLLMKLDASIQVAGLAGESTRETDAPGGPALLGFNRAGDAAIAYYPSTQVMMTFFQDEWDVVPFDPQPLRGTVVAVGLQGAGRALVVIGRDRLSLVRIRLSDGAVEDETLLGPGSDPALVFGDGSVLFTRDRNLVYRDPAGTENLAPSPDGISAFAQMGSGWVQLQSASGQSYALRLGPGLPVYEIPEVAQ